MGKLAHERYYKNDIVIRWLHSSQPPSYNGTVIPAPAFAGVNYSKNP